MFNQFDSSENLSLDYHGVDKDIFDKNHQSPYKKVSINAVWIGNNYFDHTFLKIAANAKKDWYFHIIGNIAKKYVSDNGKIISSKITSVSFGKQKKLTKEIKKAKILGLI